MAATTDELNLVRLYIGDPSGPKALLTDDDLQLLWTDSGGIARLTAAAALETIAASEVLVAKKIRTQTLTTDGPAVSAELRALAAAHRKRYQELVDADDEGLFDVVDTLPPDTWPEATNRVVDGL